MKYLWMLSLALLVACGGGGDDDDPQGAGTGVFGQVTALGQPVSGATVRVGSTSAQTDAEGRYRVAAPAGPAVVTVEADGHLINVQRTTIAGATALHMALLPEAPAQPLDATMGGTITGGRGAQVTVPANGLVDAQGQPVTGEIAVHLTPIDPAREDELFAAPGDFEARTQAGEVAQLESFGMLDITMRRGDDVLQVAPGQTFEIQIPAPDGMIAHPDSMPLWSFNETTGVWVEEGTLRYDATEKVYVGEIAHMSMWNADVVIDTTCIKGRVVDADGAPVAGARVRGRGVDYYGTDSSTANANGEFALLVRKDSEVSVLALHAEGGGEGRTVRSGSDTARQPPSIDDPACVDGGTWTVRRGEVVFDDGRRVSCSGNAFDDLGLTRCVPLLAEVGRCFQPSGACTEEGVLNVRYANGSRLETNIGDGNMVTIGYFGPNGEDCGRQIVDASAGGAQVTMELPSGRRETYSVRVDTDSGAVTYGCVGGGELRIDQADQERIAACTGAAEECESSDNPGFGQCEDDADCNGGSCCFGVCVPSDFCPSGTACADNSMCGDDEICCPATNDCKSEAACADYGWCDRDEICGENRACCDNTCSRYPFCEGSCRGDGDCEEGVCCPGVNEPNYCSDSAESCYNGRECTVDADCGIDSFTCCDGSCRSWESCFGNEQCADDSACGGEGSPLVCCDRGDFMDCETPLKCASFRPCDAENPCGGGTACCNNPQISNEPICLGPELCTLNLPCEAQADCGALFCCAVPGIDQPYCSPQCQEDWRR